MPRIPTRRQDLPHRQETFTAVERALGVLPSSTRTMGRWPKLMEAFTRLRAAVMYDGRVNGCSPAELSCRNVIWRTMLPLAGYQLARPSTPAR